MTVCYCIFQYSSHVSTRKYRSSVFKCSPITGVCGILIEIYTVLYLPIFTLNTGKYSTKNDRIHDDFRQWKPKNIHSINSNFQQNITVEPILSHLWKFFFTSLKKVILWTLFQPCLVIVETTTINIRWFNFHLQPHISGKTNLMKIDDHRYFNVDLFPGK